MLREVTAGGREGWEGGRKVWPAVSVAMREHREAVSLWGARSLSQAESVWSCWLVFSATLPHPTKHLPFPMWTHLVGTGNSHRYIRGDTCICAAECMCRHVDVFAGSVGVQVCGNACVCLCVSVYHSSPVLVQQSQE